MARKKLRKADRKVPLTSCVPQSTATLIGEFAESRTWSISQAIAKLIEMGLSKTAEVGAGSNVTESANGDAARV